MTRTKQTRASDSQRSLPFRRPKARILSQASGTERLLFVAVATCFVFAAILYVYAVMSSVVRVAHIEELNTMSSKIEARVAVLETDYLGDSQQITSAFARSLGYVHADVALFLERRTALTVRE